MFNANALSTGTALKPPSQFPVMGTPTSGRWGECSKEVSEPLRLISYGADGAASSSGLDGSETGKTEGIIEWSVLFMRGEKDVWENAERVEPVNITGEGGVLLGTGSGMRTCWLKLGLSLRSSRASLALSLSLQGIDCQVLSRCETLAWSLSSASDTADFLRFFVALRLLSRQNANHERKAKRVKKTAATTQNMTRSTGG
jgi:hypothetical protein